MKREFLIFLVLVIMSVIVFSKSFANFFAQDDFVLIQEFSGGNFTLDIARAFGPPTVTHWRPMHNLYFLATGNLFHKNLVAYHIVTFIIHIVSAFLIYKIAYRLHKDLMTSIASGIVYACHPAFFISLFWISGSATTIGFFFFVFSFYLYLVEKRGLWVLLFFLSMLASEAMLVGVFIFIAYRFCANIQKNKDNFWLKIALGALLFIALRFVFFKSVSLGSDYQLRVGFVTLSTLKYYVLRMFAFPDIPFDLIWILLLIFWACVLVISSRNIAREKFASRVQFYSAIIVFGLFPFIFLPNHLSAHYINISVFGFCLLLGYLLSKTKPVVITSIVVIFGLLSAGSVNGMITNSWVVRRSKIAKEHIRSIERLDPPENSWIVFGDNSISSSYEAYISLGTGKALDFWFGEKNYKSCFRAFEICEIKP